MSRLNTPLLANQRDVLALEQAETILNNIVNSQTEVSTLLRKLWRLAQLLGKDVPWINDELTGFNMERFAATTRRKINKIAPYRVAKSTSSWSWIGELPPEVLAFPETKNDFYKRGEQDIVVTESCGFLERKRKGWTVVDRRKATTLHGVEVDRKLSVSGDECSRILDSVVNRIFDFASRVSIDLRFIAMTEGIFHETKQYVDPRLGSIAPNALEKLLDTYEQLTRKRDVQWNLIAYSCRDILQDFAGAIFKEEYLKENEDVPTREQTKNRVFYALRAKVSVKQDRELKLLSAQVEYLTAYFSRLSDYIQKETHPKGFLVNREDAHRCLIYTYLIIGDILKVIST